MDIVVAFAVTLVGLLTLGLAGLAWGVDSREVRPDRHGF